MKNILPSAILALLPCVAATAPLGEFSETFFFGDSFTDGGAAFDLAGPGEVPPAVYPNGQLTNGDVWATMLGGTYVDGTYLSLTGFGTTNFAVGGAEAVAEPDDRSPDLGLQIGTFLTYVNLGRVVPPDSLAMILMGANDIGEAGSRVDPTIVDPGEFGAALLAAAREIGTEVIGSIVAGTSALLQGGVSKVAVFGLPDLGIFPSVREDGISSVATAYTSEYNAALQGALNGNFSSDEVEFIDTFGIFEDIIANAGALGITNLTDPCLTTPECFNGDRNSHFFYDSVHPTEVVHAALADAVRMEFPTPVPLPASTALLLAGLGGLAVVRMTGRRSRA